RLNEYESVQLDRATISTYGERSVIQSETASLLARRARLDAAINDAQTVRFPPSLTHLSVEAAIAAADEQRSSGARAGAFERPAAVAVPAPVPCGRSSYSLSGPPPRSRTATWRRRRRISSASTTSWRAS